MAVTFVILLILALFHFVYESILMPMFRLRLRYKLFELRDQLRNVECEFEKKPSHAEIVKMLDNAICGTIKRLPQLSFSTSDAARREYKTNEQFKKRFDKRKSLISNSDSKLINVEKRLISLTGQAVVLNSGGWVYIIVPIFILISFLFIFTKTISTMKRHIYNEVSKVTYASDHSFSQFPLAVPTY